MLILDLNKISEVKGLENLESIEKVGLSWNRITEINILKLPKESKAIQKRTGWIELRFYKT